MKRRIGYQANQCTFQLPNVRFDLAGDIEGNIIRQRNVLTLRLLCEDGDFGFEVGRLYVGDQTPLKPGMKPLLERWNIARRAVRGEYELLVRVVESVKGVKELLLSSFLGSDEL